jgi:hypothetical protein
VLTPGIARLVEPRPESFAEAMLQLIDQPAERARLAAAAAAVAQEKYSRESYLRRTAQAYEQLCGDKPCSSAEAGNAKAEGLSASKASTRKAEGLSPR